MFKPEEKIEEQKIFPKSPISRNTLKDFAKICRAYYNEVMHIASKDPKPSLGKKDLLVLDHMLHEIYLYSQDLIAQKCAPEAKSLVEIGLVITDFVLKIFGKIPENEEQEINLIEKLEYPLSKKLILLQANFNILFKYEKNFDDAEKNIEEIIEIQQFLNSPKTEMAISNFYLAMTSSFLKDIQKAEKYANKALEMLEDTNENNKKEEPKKQEKNKENKDGQIKENKATDIRLEENKTKRISMILEFLGDIYQIEKNYNKAQACFEKVYYLNLGKYGIQNSHTLYYKEKLDYFKKENHNLSKTFGANMSQNISQSPSKYQVQNTSNMNSSYFSRTAPLNPKMDISNNYSSPKKSTSNTKSIMSKTAMPLSMNTLHKGKAETFCFKIPTSNFYEPLLIAIYALADNPNSDRYSSDLFVCNLCFDKLKLLRFLNENEKDNNIFYIDESLNLILENIVLDERRNISFIDNELMFCLINSINNHSK